MLIEPLQQHHRFKRTWTLFAIGIAVTLSLLIMYNETAISKGKTTFFIPHSSVKSVAKSLEENGYELNFVDYLVLGIVHLPKKGWYRIHEEEPGRFFFLKNLYKKRVKALNIRVFAGETKKEIFYRLSRELMLDEKKLEGNYTKLARFEEGNILANRYFLPRSPDEENIIRYLLDKSNEKLDAFAQNEFGSDFNTSEMRRSLIIASIIQKESNDADEMADISAVIHNRLKKGMRLQMDGTLNYGKYSRTIVTPERIKNDKSRYNTYRHKGLVPAPLGSVSMEALRAAVFPKKNNYLFFVLSENGKHIFADNYKKHLENVKVFKTWLRKREEKRKAEEALHSSKTAEMEKKKQEIFTKRNEKMSLDTNKTEKKSHKVELKKKTYKKITAEQKKEDTKKSSNKYKEDGGEIKKAVETNRRGGINPGKIEKLFSDINASRESNSSNGSQPRNNTRDNTINNLI